MQLVTSLFWFLSLNLFLAEKPQVAVSIAECQVLYAGISNPVHIVAQQKAPVKISQISATVDVYDHEKVLPVEIRGDNGDFILIPKSTGQLTLKVQTQAGLYTTKYHVRPIKPVTILAMIKEDGHLSNGAFKIQEGIVPVIECCGFDARCDILQFSMIKIGQNGTSKRVKNIGGKFEAHTKAIIQSAKPGDIYWFRNVMCRCPGSKEDIEATALSIEIE